MPTNDDNKKIYKKLREFRRARGLTTHSLAEKMGENPQKIGRIERGARNLTVDYLVKVSKALETPLNALLEEETEKNEKKQTVSNILQDIIIFVEQHQTSLPILANPEKKAKAISKIYELVFKFPIDEQKLFLSSLSEAVLLLNDLASS